MKHIKLLSFMYFEDRASQRFRAMRDNATLHQVFDFLQDEGQVLQMIASSRQERPAMEGIILMLEQTFSRSEAYDLKENMKHRQITGSMIRFIMGHYGYGPGRAKTMKAGSFVKTAITYYR